MAATASMTEEELQLPADVAHPPETEYDSVSFHHPYHGTKFLILSKVDIVCNKTTTLERRTLHIKTALYACNIIACNESGFFSTERERDSAIVAKLEGDYLDVERVFYHLDDGAIANRYPLCTNFRKWKFPSPNSKSLLDWRAIVNFNTVPIDMKVTRNNMIQAVKLRDQSCRITHEKLALDTCHLIPRADGAWFIHNNMDTHCRDAGMDVDDEYNATTLRADIRRIFDDGDFVCSPKNGHMRIHFLSTGAIGSYIQYQNSSFPTENIALEFLYARFAWAVFKALSPVRMEVDFSPDGKPKGDDDDDDEHGDPGTKGDNDNDAGLERRPKRPRDESQGNLEIKRAKYDPKGSREDRIRRRFPFFWDPTVKASAYLYETLPWQPEGKEIQKQKEKWFAEHPNIREVEGTEFADSSIDNDSD